MGHLLSSEYREKHLLTYSTVQYICQFHEQLHNRNYINLGYTGMPSALRIITSGFVLDPKMSRDMTKPTK